MSEETLDLVRRAYEVIHSDIESFLALCDPEIEFVNPDDAVEPGVRRGHDGVRKWFATLSETYDWQGRGTVRMVDLDDRVVVEHAATMVGRLTGLAVDTRFGHIWTLRDGKILRWEWFREPAQAFSAAGLNPDATR
jgi:uncharacterized protein